MTDETHAVQEALAVYATEAPETEHVPEGYKQTEVGVIPEDWETASLSELSVFITKGSTPTTYGYKWETGGTLFLRSECVSETGLDLTQSMFISPDAHAALRRSEVDNGDLLMTITGNVGRIIVLNDLSSPANINQHIARIRLVAPEAHAEFVHYFLSQPWIRKYYESITTGQAYPQISLQQVRDTEIYLPPLPEQRAIASALSDVDALISSLDRLISKKRAVKTAAMQQLLTGKQRLPGFSGEWDMRRLGDVSAIKTGSKNNQDKIEDGTYPFFVRSQHVEKINTYSYDGEAILVPGEGGIGSIFHYICGKFDYHQRVYKISDFRDDTCGKFIYYGMIQNFGEQATSNSVKATVDSLRLPTFLSFTFQAPSIDEQTAIATVLSDMDAEISALEARREKTRQVKQGMMQELLTGRTRLV